MLSFSLVQTENHKWEYQKLEPKIIFSPKKKPKILKMLLNLKTITYFFFFWWILNFTV